MKRIFLFNLFLAFLFLGMSSGYSQSEEKKESEQEEKTSRKAAQNAEEKKSEKAAKEKATKSLKGFKAPKMGFLDMIKRFFKNILLGGFILKALDWFQNAENQKKIQTTDFLWVCMLLKFE